MGGAFDLRVKRLYLGACKPTRYCYNVVQKMKTLILAVILIAMTLSSCVMRTDSKVGVNSSEMLALKETYYWEDRYDLPTFKTGELEALMDRSADPSLDGEHAEGQSSAVAVALVTVGDQRFAIALMSRSTDVQNAVIGDVEYMWMHYGLDYPKTQAIKEKIKQNSRNMATPRKQSD